jgi:AP-1 complex subunit gamma-1
MLCLAGNHVTDESVGRLINLIVSTPELHLYSVIRLYNALRNNINQEGLTKVAVYIIGELGEKLINNNVDPVSEEDVLDILDKVNERKTSASIKEYLVNAYMKLMNKFSEPSRNKLRRLLEQESHSYYCEVQNRAVEYLVLANAASNLKNEILKPVPNSKIVKESEVNK